MVEERKQGMETEEESLNLLEHYLGIGQKTLYLIIALVATAFVVATVIYIAAFGFQSWKTNMGRARDMMVINFDAPVAGSQGMTAPLPAPAAIPAAAQSQYLCPSCGVLGAPMWGPGGAPLCPTCGTLMATSGQSGANLNLGIGL